jgi:hypothetical protein
MPELRAQEQRLRERMANPWPRCAPARVCARAAWDARGSPLSRSGASGMLGRSTSLDGGNLDGGTTTGVPSGREVRRHSRFKARRARTPICTCCPGGLVDHRGGARSAACERVHPAGARVRGDRRGHGLRPSRGSARAGTLPCCSPRIIPRARRAFAEAFVAEQRHGTLLATPPDGHPQASLLPFVKRADLIELRHVQADPTFGAVRANPRVRFLLSDYLA